MFLELLQVIGGDLNISKCACFTNFHRRSGGKATLLKKQIQHPFMTITHPITGEIKTIDRKDPDEAHRSLGGMMTTNGKQSVVQFKILKSKAKQFTGAIHECRVQRYDATTAYSCYYISSIGYTVATTHFSVA
jgi:hypothetical protein